MNFALFSDGFSSILKNVRRRIYLLACREFFVGYSKAPEQLQSNARPMCHFHVMTRKGHEPATIRIIVA